MSWKTVGKLVIKAIEYFILLAIAFFIIINIHEIGHTVVAYVLGDKNAHYTFLKFENGKLTAIGHNVYNLHIFNWWQIILISLAGVIFTQITNVLLIKLKNHLYSKNQKDSSKPTHKVKSRQQKGKQKMLFYKPVLWLQKIKPKIIKFLNFLIFAATFDLVFQEYQGLVANIVNRVEECGGSGICGNDFADVFWIIFTKLGWSSKTGEWIIKIGSLVIVMMWLDRIVELEKIREKNNKKQSL